MDGSESWGSLVRNTVNGRVRCSRLSLGHSQVDCTGDALLAGQGSGFRGEFRSIVKLLNHFL
jgi:hypothetical protein